MRLKIVQIITAGAFIFLSLGLFYTQIVRGNKYRQLSEANRIRLISQRGSRGRIFDRNGTALVDNRLCFNVAILPRQAKVSEKVLLKLSKILGIPYQDLESKFKIERDFSSLPLTLVKDIEKKEAIIIEELKSDLPGVIIEVIPERYYPHGKLASHILGYIGFIDYWRLTKLKDYGYKTKDIVGYTGVEEKYDYYLRPEEGGLQVEIDNQNRLIRILGFKPSEDGRNVQLTIDLRIQEIVERSLINQRGAVIILEPHTGEILAMASSPNFYPARFLKRTPRLFRLLNDPAAPLLNRCISGGYPAGSIFKLIVATAGLETRKIDLKETFDCQGSINLGRDEFSCWNTHGSVNLVEAIKHSCNVFFYRLGIRLGPDRLQEYAIKLGLGKPTQIDLSSESAGLIPSPLRKRLNKFKGWYDGDTANFAIGQGDLLVTPLQIARLISIFANSGNLVRPYLIKSINGEDTTGYQRKVIPLSLKQTTLDAIKEGLEKSVSDSDGTAYILQLDRVSVAGKTGTAQVTRGQPHAWFSGYFPSDNPGFSICVLLEQAGSSYNACLVAKDIIQNMKRAGLL